MTCRELYNDIVTESLACIKELRLRKTVQSPLPLKGNAPKIFTTTCHVSKIDKKAI